MTIATQSESFWCNLIPNHTFDGFDIGFSHFHHNFAMFTLNPQKWMNLAKKFIKTITGYIGFINNSSVEMFSFLRNRFFPEMNSQNLLEPFHNGNINRCKFQNCSVYQGELPGFGFDCVDVEATISVDITSKISKYRIIHVNSFTTLYIQATSTVNDLAERIRKYMRKSDLATKAQEGNPKSFPRLDIGHKSNSLPVLNSAAARLGQSLRETQDALQRDNLESSASIINCVGGQNGDIPTEMSITDVDDVFTVLQNNSAEYITNIVEADLKFGTSPIGDAYGCMLTTRMIPVLYNMTGFIKKFQYPNISQTLTTELGGANNIRFFVSEQGSVSPNASMLGNDVANCFVAAKESYKVVWQAGGKARFIYLPPGYNNDPCMLRHTAGCSFYQGQCITNDLWIQNLRSTGI